MKQSTSWQLKSSKATVSFPRCRSDPKMAATCSSEMKGIEKYGSSGLARSIQQEANVK
jgi:hypothetical protein